MTHYPTCRLHDIPQRSPEWFEARKGYLTASKFGEWLADYQPKLMLTIEEIKTELTELGIAYPAKATKDKYTALLPNLQSYFGLTDTYKKARLTAASQVLAEMAGYPDPPPYVTEDMQRGIDFEPTARRLFEDRHCLTFGKLDSHRALKDISDVHLMGLSATAADWRSRSRAPAS
jgi:hypothetical protein